MQIVYDNYYSEKGYVIGMDIPINPQKYFFNGINDDSYLYDESILEWGGYIPFGTKIVYNMWLSFSDYSSYNAGGYYYLDDEEYIGECIYFLKDEYIPDIETLINYVYAYLCNKLEKNVNKKDRADIHRLVRKDEDTFFEPVREYSIKDFYHNGSALCSEYGVMAQNILSFLDLDVTLVFTGSHAFQLLKIDDDYYALDFSKTVAVLNYDMKYINKVPYFCKIGPLDDEWLKRFFDGEEKISLKEYYIQSIGNHFYKMETNYDRIYSIDFNIERKVNNHEGDIRIIK